MTAERKSDNNTPDSTATTPAISAALRRRLQQCFEPATKLMQQEKYDHDYANALLTECVQHDPGNLLYVEKFLENLQRKYDNNKKGARFSGFGGRGAFKKAVAKKAPLEILLAGPALLKINPWDVATLRPMAEACEALDLREIELRYLRNALDANPKDPEVNRHCAKSLQRMGQYDQAIVCWHRVEEALKHDPEAPRMIADLQIEKTRARGGFGEAARGRPGSGTGLATGRHAAGQPSSTGEAVSSDPKTGASATDGVLDGSHSATNKREFHLTPRQKLERAIHEDSTDIESLVQLAQLHLDEHRLGDAEIVLKRALAVSGNDHKIREKYEDVAILRRRQQLSVSERLAASERTPESQELVTQLRTELNRVELEIYRGRCDRYPNESAYRYQFGLRLKRAANFAEAIVQFTELAENSSQAVAAALELGECFQMLKQYQPALKWYRRAVEGGAGGEQPEIRKLALYRGAVLATALNELDVGESLLAQLVKLDEGYKDAADRLDKLRQIRHKEGP